MTEPARVSVIIPARNEERFVGTALASVASQAYPPGRLEVIVVENGSTDRTAEVVRRIAQSSVAVPVTLVLELEPGVARAKNAGAAAAGGDILVFLDADSRMDPRLCSDIVDRYRAGCLAGSIKVYADSTHPIDRAFFALMEVGKVWFGVRAQMLFCGRELFHAAGGFKPELRLAEDVEFLDRVRAELGRRGASPLCHIRSSGIATSPRRLRSKPFGLGMAAMFVRWALAFSGFGREREY